MHFLKLFGNKLEGDNVTMMLTVTDNDFNTIFEHSRMASVSSRLLWSQKGL